jgi:methionyl-tRNA synthetase
LNPFPTLYLCVMNKRFTVTAALPYANGPVHIGHLAGAYLPADIFVRYLRSTGKEVVFICGTDEHGVAITLKARKEGLSPQQVVDKYHLQIRDSFKQFGISFDVFSRTTHALHHETAGAFFRKFYEEGKFQEKETDQYFDPEAGQFLADRYIIGTCPKCDFDKAYGDQCESCGTSLSPSDLKSPRSALSGATPVLKPTKHWFLPLDQYQKALEHYVLDNHKDWKPNVYGQCKSWLIGDGLQPRSMTRDLDWGVKVPVEGVEGKVLYVWFDAPLGYITATKEWAIEKGDPDAWKKYWLKEEADGETSLVCFIGKDNIVFHCLIFPAILMGHGDYILPDQVPANEFLNLEGQKISTSRDWAVWLHTYLEEFPGQADVLRFVLASTMPETKDNDFTWKDFQARNNNELVAIYGNFVNRVLVLTEKYFNRQVPENLKPEAQDDRLRRFIQETAEKAGKSIESYRFREALSTVMDLARAGNKYLADLEPWKLWKTDPDRVASILLTSLEVSAALSVLFEPFLPETSHKLNRMLGIARFSWNDLLQEKTLIFPGHPLGEVSLMFQKIEDETIQAQIQKLEMRAAEIKQEQNAASPVIQPLKDPIDFESFGKMDIRTAKILDAVKVPKADKLLQLRVDTGIDQRTIVSGIAEHFNPEEIIGQEVLVLVNLIPRKLKGIESQGMILMAEGPDGKLHFVNASSNVPPGMTVR